MNDFELANCKHEVESKILHLENQILVRLTGMDRDLASVRADVNDLVTRPEFHPVKLITYGLSGGVLMTALAAIMARVLGWG